jgi:hypothetical protein
LKGRRKSNFAATSMKMTLKYFETNVKTKTVSIKIRMNEIHGFHFVNSNQSSQMTLLAKCLKANRGERA